MIATTVTSKSNCHFFTDQVINTQTLTFDVMHRKVQEVLLHNIIMHIIMENNDNTW